MKKRLTLSVLLAVLGLVLPLAGCDDGGKSNNANNVNLCGNDQVDTGEACDGPDLAGYTCEDLLEGFTGGTLACDDSCHLDTSLCTTNCTNVCTLGSTQCNTAATGIETCITGASGCTEWQNAPCGAGTPLCQLDGGLPTCVIDCTGFCTINSSRCNTEFTGIETCVLGANGCGEYQNAECAPATPDCTIDGGLPVCVNNCLDECTADEVRCNDAGDGIETCVTAVTGCTAWENAACGIDTPLCELRADAPTCVVDCGVHECVIGEAECDEAGGSIETCIADADGCPELQVTACDVATPFCEIVSDAPVCLETCLDDCTLDAVRCNGDADGIETCVTGANGCAEWDNTACAPEIPDCQDLDGTPTCLYTNGSGESCSDLFRVRLPLWVEGEDFTADYTTEDMLFSDVSCEPYYGLGSGPEAVFSYEMTAGEAVVFAQGLGVDGQLFIQSACSESAACLEIMDDGFDGDIERIQFTAPAAGTYYFIVKSFYTAPDPATYAIALYAYEPSGEVTCDDLFDNDDDDLWDCEDPNCAGIAPCGPENTLERCTDRIDNDNDGATDCADTDCGGIGSCSPENDESACADTLDNDGDGTIDCADDGCSGIGACTETTLERCTDALDNDLDGAADCADADCDGIGPCAPENTESACADTLDNDGDGTIDCADDGCSGIGACPTILLNEKFETWPPADWTITNGGSTTYTWQSSATSTAGLTLTGGTGKYAIVDSDEPGSSYPFDDSLVSPVIDCSALTTVSLSFRHYYDDFSANDSAAVEISTNGSTWTPVVTYTSDVTNGTVVNLDLSTQAAGQATFQIRFRYVTTSYDYYWLIDDVRMIGN